MRKVITINQKEEWIGYVAKSKNYDFYHSRKDHFYILKSTSIY